MTRFLIIFCVLVLGLVVLFHPESEGQIMPFGFMEGTTTTTTTTTIPFSMGQYFAVSNECANGDYQDSSIYDNDGTQSVGAARATWTENGLDFDGGDDNINLGDVFNFGAGEITFSFWVNLESVSSWQVPISKYRTTVNERQWLVYITSSGALRFVTSANGSTVKYSDTSSAVITATNTWYHVAVVKDGTETTFYVDGGLESDDGTAVDATIVTHDTNAKIGVYDPAVSPINGLMARVKIFTNALSSNEVYDIFMEGH